MGELKKQHIQIAIKNGSAEYAYTPYYVFVPSEAQVIMDAYVAGNGKTWREYDYYPRSDVESLENSKLGEASELWIEYRKFVKEEYLNYPDDLDRLESFCDNIGKDSQKEVTTYINAYFRRNLAYSYAPGKCPKDKDFIEYFMFDNHKGFCVHFASAATVMYRMCGYPARYVEGYMVSSDAFELQNDGTYKARVTDKMAHAWSETFDDEKGWQVKEHTLGYGGETQNENQNVTYPNTETETATTQNNNLDNATNNATEKPEETTAKAGQTNGDSGTGKNEESSTRVESKIKYVIIGILISMLLVIIQRRIRRKRKIQSFRKVKQNRGITNIYNEVYEICIFQGMKKSKKNDREIVEDMKANFQQLSPEEWEWMYVCAEKAAFTPKHIGREEQRYMYKLYQKFRKEIKSEMSIGKKILFLYIRAM